MDTYTCSSMHHLSQAICRSLSFPHIPIPIDRTTRSLYEGFTFPLHMMTLRSRNQLEAGNEGQMLSKSSQLVHRNTVDTDTNLFLYTHYSTRTQNSKLQRTFLSLCS